MIVDTDGSSCVVVNFGIGAGTTNTQRQWDIMVWIPLVYIYIYIITGRYSHDIKLFFSNFQTTQYRCGDENGGKCPKMNKK